jgi:anaphase-promoting complex subunit 2
LAQRFLANFDCKVDFERRNLELLTLKFGESDLHACEVMLHDMTSSKRVDGRINAGEISAFHPENFNINCLILSKQFWPEKLGLANADESSNLKLPAYVSEAITTYTKAFETIKGSRTLEWKPHLGLVEIELEFNDQQITFNVTPIQACIMWHFQEKSTWKISDLSQALDVSASLVRRKILFWQNKGILREVALDQYAIIEDQSTHSTSAPSNQVMNVDEDYDEDYGEDLVVESGAVKQAPGDERFRVIWSFVKNMLTNLNTLPLERIHGMLKMFAQGANASDLTTQELKQFLDNCVREQKLVYSGGQYRLPSSN